MRILITGANGQLGMDLQNALKGHTLYPFARAELDITAGWQTIETIARSQPEVVIHAAAYTNVDGCESDPDLAYRINAVGTRNVAVGCQQCGAAMVYVSTDFVFDGKKREPYLEFDEPNPLSVYGRSKLAGERYVQSLLNKYFIVRTSWLYGKHGKNFVRTMLDLARQGKQLKVVDDQVGSPTYSFDLAKTIRHLVETPFYGIYHVSNRGAVSWYGFAKKIFELAGMDVSLEPATSDELGRPARRPAYSVFRRFALETSIGDEMRPWEEALSEYLKEIGADGKAP